MSVQDRLRAVAAGWPATPRVLLRRGLEACRLANSGIVDLQYYQAQTGQTFRNVRAVAWHYLAEGSAAGLSVHPLFEPEVVARRMQHLDGDPTLGYLVASSLYKKHSPHPVFNLRAAKEALAARGIESSSGPWLAWVRSATPETPVPVSRGMTPTTWGRLRAVLLRSASEWRAQLEEEAPVKFPTADTPRESRLTSIVVPPSDKLSDSLQRLALLGGPDDARELVFVGVRTRSQFTSMTALGLFRPIRIAHGLGSLAAVWNSGAAASSGETLVFVSAASRLGPEAVTQLVAALDDPGTGVVQPLNEKPDMTINSAGACFPPTDVVPSPLLAAHPVGDAVRLGPRVAIPAALSGVVAMRAGSFLALRGFDPDFGNDLSEVDLSLRAAQQGHGQTVLVPEARCTTKGLSDPYLPNPEASAKALKDRWAPPLPSSEPLLEAAGFRVTGYRATSRNTGGGTNGVQKPDVARLRSGLAALPSLRWTVDTSVTAGWWAEAWGDWHFARSLARALERLGQQVSVDTKQARGRSTRSLDDVVLTLRGLDAPDPVPGPVNLLWVISHPGEVTASEVGSYDAAFAASTTWAEDRSAQWGIRVDPLLQCTDAELFHPGRGVAEPSSNVVFVGNARRGSSRPILEHALDSGVELELYGTGWEGRAQEHLVAEKVPNADLGRIYAEAGVVLNDHWEDMRELGFISNRLFDAVACGARVLSDPVAGASELFGGSVVFCTTSSQVEQALRQPFDQNWPTAEQRRANAHRVLAEQSFDQRAAVLLARVIQVLGGATTDDASSSA